MTTQAELDHLMQIENHMHDYQKKKGIRTECIMNTWYFAEQCRARGTPAQILPVMVRWMQDGIPLMGSHMVVQVDTTLFDVSYETAKHLPTYHTSLEEIREMLKGYVSIGPVPTHDIIPKFLKFKEVAEQMNAGRRPWYSKEYYEGQDAYVKEKMQ